MKKLKKILIIILTTVLLLYSNFPVLAITVPSLYEPNYKIDGDYITNIAAFTTPVLFRTAYEDDVTIVIETANGENITSSDSVYIATGDKITIDGREYTAIVYGDIDGDGEYTYKDVLTLEAYLNDEELDDSQFDIGDGGSRRRRRY